VAAVHWASRNAAYRHVAGCRQLDLITANASSVGISGCPIRPSSRWDRGIGKKLCNAALQRAGDAGFQTLILWSMEFNARADRFFTGLGFIREDVTMSAERPFESLRGRRYRREVERLDEVQSDSVHASP